MASELLIWLVPAQIIITLVLAVWVVVLNVQQLQISRKKLVLDLFERRYAVYRLLRTIVSELDQLGKTEDPNATRELIAQALFLFPEEIRRSKSAQHTNSNEKSTIE